MLWAKKMLIIIGKESMIKFMIQNNDIKSRNTGLIYKIKKYKKVFKEI